MLLHIVLLFIVFYVIGYLYLQSKYSYWQNRNVPYLKPTFPYGNISSVRSKIHSGILFKRYYDEMKSKAKLCGFYFFIQPYLLITDLEVIKNILVKDFQYFMNRGNFFNDKDDPLAGHLFNIENQKWKVLRAKLTPTFTSGKMKYMLPTIVSVAEEFKHFIANEIQTTNEFEMKDLLARFTTDVIGNCAFGLECNSIKDPNAEFRVFGRKVFTRSNFGRLKFMFGTVFPEMAKKLRLVIRDKETINFFVNSVKQTVQYRDQHKIKRNDFMDLLIGVKADCGMTIEDLAAQAFVFFVAGFETSSTTMSFALYELVMQQQIQQKARDEVKRVLKKYNNEFTYDAVMEMKYLDQIINESLRKYPPGVLLRRRATADYTEPITGVTIKKGINVFIPVYAIHHDAEYYPNPEVFDPERFTEKEMAYRNPYTFMPFGEGPRNCIGLRFGLLQAKIGLAMLLNNFKFSKTPSVPDNIEYVANAIILTIKGGLHLKIEKLQ